MKAKLCFIVTSTLRVSDLGQSRSNLETKTEVKIYEDTRIIEAYHTGDRASGANGEKNNQVKDKGLAYLTVVKIFVIFTWSSEKRTICFIITTELMNSNSIYSKQSLPF